jgi:oligopeptide/dipeptide ABC transporter ATP-binding protein
MYLGRVVEQAPVRAVLRDPRHPYTAGLLASLPGRVRTGERLPAIEGMVPSPLEIPPGCPFHPRCALAQAGRCDQGAPPPLENLATDRQVACWRAAEIGGRP